MFKFIVSALFLALMTSTAFAKSPKIAGKINYQAVKVGFDSKYYYQLTYNNRLKYLQEIQSLMMIVHKEKGIKGNAWIELLLLNTADAADVNCMSGGIGYTASSSKECGKLPDSFNLDESLSSCPADSQRCSLAFGLGADNKALCYPMADEKKKATSLCNSGSDSAKGLERLNAELSKCEGFSSGRCNALRSALEKDTKSIEAACKSGFKTACNTTKKKIEGLGKYSGSGSTVRDDDGCAAAEASVYQDLLSSKLGTDKINKKWLKLVSLSTQTCPGAGKLEDQLKKFGACTTPDTSKNVDGDIAGDGELQGAVRAIMNPGTYKSTGEQDTAFRRYFGVNPVEFKNLFCGSKDTKDFYWNVNDLKGGKETASMITDRNMYAYMLNDKKVFERHRAGMSGNLRTPIESFYATKEKSDALYDDWQRCSKAGSEKCGNAAEKKKAYEDFSKNNTSAVSMVAAMFPGSDPKQDSFNNSSIFKSNMGGSYNGLKADYAAYSEAKDGSLDSAGTTADRNQFKKCVDTAIKRTPGARGEDTFTSNYANNDLYHDADKKNRNKNCTRNLIDDLLARPSDSSKVWLRITTNDSDAQNNHCFVSDGKTYNRGVNGLDCTTAIQVESAVNKDKKFVCIDKGKTKYTAYGFKCDNATGYAPVQDPEQAADAIIK